MTNIERFQKLQVELVRVGFTTELHASPDGEDKAVISMVVDLHEQTGGEAESGGIERLDTLAQAHGFAYVVGERSQATLTLAR